MKIKRISDLPQAAEIQIEMSNGLDIPILGFGTYQLGRGPEAVRAISDALEAGYRHIDTAALYGNEAEVGEAVRRSGLRREEVFITTKLWNSDHGYEKAKKAYHRSLSELDLGYVDLYLIHWPVRRKRLKSWDALTDLLEEDTCRAIGVSNYMPWHLDELATHSSVPPSVNQVEFSPFLYQKDLLEECRGRGILLEGYSPLTKGHYLGDETLGALAAKYGKSAAQILIRWHIQHGIVVLPKSAQRERIIANAAVFDFEIGSEDMDTLDSLNRDLRVSWDPSREK